MEAWRSCNSVTLMVLLNLDLFLIAVALVVFIGVNLHKEVHHGNAH